MASKRIDELTTRVVVNTDLLPPTPTGGPSGSATVAEVVKAGLSQPNSASAGAGADVTIKAADGVTSGAGGSIILQPGAQATTGGNGAIIIASTAGNTDFKIIRNSSTEMQLTFPSGSKFTVKRSDIGRRIELNPEGGIDYSAGIIMTGPAPTIHVIQNFATSAINASFFFYSHGGFGGEFGFGLSGQSNTGCTLIRNQDGTSGGTLAAKAATTNISSNQNDLSLGTSMFCRLNCTVASDVTGIAWPAGVNGSHTDGRMISICNIGSAKLTFKHNSTSSSAANRIYCPSASDLILGTNEWLNLVYDSTDNGSGAAGWRVTEIIPGRIDELSTRVVVNTDLLPPTPVGGPSGSATVAAVVAAGLSQPNSASSGAGANLTIKAADGVTSGAGGNIILQPGAQATTGGDGVVKFLRNDGSTTFTVAPNYNTYNAGMTWYRKSDNAVIASIYLSNANSGSLNFDNPFGHYFSGQVTINSACVLNNVLCLGGVVGGAIKSAARNILGIYSEYNVSVGGSLAYKSTTTNLSADTNDLVLDASTFQRINCTVASNLTGISYPASSSHVDGRMIKVFNVGTANLTFKHNSASSSAANRLYAASGADIVLGTNDYIECVYDSTDNGSGAAGWRIA